MANPAGSLKLIAVAGYICFLLLPAHVFALNPSRSVGQYLCQNWARDDGLPVNGINAIAQTTDGFLWLGTQKGLVRFDGVEFKVLSLPSGRPFRNQVISSVSTSDDGGLWFGIRLGSFGYYHPDKGFSSFLEEAWVHPAMDVRSIRETSDGAVWVGSTDGVMRWARGPTSETSLVDDVNGSSDITQTAQKRVWLGTIERGLSYWEGGKRHLFPDQSLTNTTVYSLAEDRRGQLWVGTRTGLRCYDRAFEPVPIPPVPQQVKALLVDSHGALWIGTTGAGLLRLYDGHWSTLDKSAGLADDNVTALLEDREGSLWVGTRNGLSQLADVKLPLFTRSEGLLPGGYHGVSVSPRGGLWIGGSYGLSYLDGAETTNYPLAGALPNAYIKRAVEAKNGDVYAIDGNKGIAVLSSGKVLARHTYFNRWPTGLVEDRHGMVVAVANELFRVDRDGISPYGAKNSVPALPWIRSLNVCRDGSLFVATVNGLFRIHEDGTFQNWSLEDGLPDSDIFWAFEDDQHIVWAGSALGLIRIRGRQIQTLNREAGLFDNQIMSVVPDDFGWLWIQSSRGIFRLRRTSPDHLVDGKLRAGDCVAFDGLDAVKSIDTTEVEFCGCKTRDGRIWFACPQGVILVDPHHLPALHVPPGVRIQRAHVNGTAVSAGSAPQVKPGSGELGFEYTAPSFVAPQKVTFRYRLDGYETSWQDAGGRRSAYYTNLKPGKYAFHVQACNADGLWDSAGDALTVEIPPHFYQAAWFRVLAAVFALALFVGAYGWRMHALERRQMELARTNELLEAKVQERTMELAEQQKQLVHASRLAGKAEVATSVLHNVGNVLNSVNVSAALLKTGVHKSSALKLEKVIKFLRANAQLAAETAGGTEKGAQLLRYLEALNQQVAAEQAALLEEAGCLTRNVEHINQVVAMQQTYARPAGIAELVAPTELLDDAIRLQISSYERHDVKLHRDFGPAPSISLDRHKVMQILINLLENAKHACADLPPEQRNVVVRVRSEESTHLHIQVIDSGVGIAPENLTRIFAHGFTTRKNGHGFGLHSGALAARELGGSLAAHSDGVGKGATFTLVLPMNTRNGAAPGVKHSAL
jgi:ligand-binding sensor domain-containing protein/signal transduction histidine kinase